MLLLGSVVAAIARVARRYTVATPASWLLHRTKPQVFGDDAVSGAKRFLTLDITNLASGETSSLGLFLMPRPSILHGTRVYGATIIHQDSTVYSAWFITDGSNCLIVFVGATIASSIEFRMKPWSRRIAIAGLLPDSVPFSSSDDAASTCVWRYCAAARSIIDVEHPTTRSDLRRVRRRIAKLLHPDLVSGSTVACRARAMAIMNAELDELGLQFPT
ncbi:hypothetical protein [Microvirga yunnanensis]|uniref:hypothetical protein n=1 Tax=Microvirga yunnanensis TaxID=2953740 RepID=UPI0021CA930C|nr:hypothetical protein [Microvirga sp. HBU65207]